MSGTQAEHYAPSGAPATGSRVEKYLPDIVNNWNIKAQKTQIGSSSPYFPQQVIVQPQVLGTPQLIPERSIDETLMQQELDRTRRAFLTEARMMEAKRLGELERKLEGEYANKLAGMRSEISQAYRVIRIYDELFARIHENNHESIIKVLEELEIDPDDLKLLMTAYSEIKEEEKAKVPV